MKLNSILPRTMPVQRATTIARGEPITIASLARCRPHLRVLHSILPVALLALGVVQIPLAGILVAANTHILQANNYALVSLGGEDGHHLALGLLTEPCYSGTMYTVTYGVNLPFELGGTDAIVIDPCTQAIVRLSDHKLLFYW